MKIDAFCHILPKEYADRFLALQGAPEVEFLK